MPGTPKSMRLQIALVGRTNAGKSSFLNLVAGQDTAIVSPLPGTTTDVVEKAMELAPLGPVLWLDTAGLGDVSALAAARLERTARIFDRADVLLLLCEAGGFGTPEEEVLRQARARGLPVLVVVTKPDLAPPEAGWLRGLADRAAGVIVCNNTDAGSRDRVLRELTGFLGRACADTAAPPSLVGDLVPPGRLAVLVVPIDLGAPRGRLILPQVQTLRDLLDHDAAGMVVKERGLKPLLAGLRDPPALVVCDSQAVARTVADTPPAVPCTTFSILFARLKSDLPALAEGAAAVAPLRDGDRILIAEACSHHASEDDIGRVKIPRWLRACSGADLTFDTTAGRDFPNDLEPYALVVQCGGCMLNRREVLSRLQRAQAAGVPMTNYGLCIAAAHGVLERVLQPFPEALERYRHAAVRENPTGRSRPVPAHPEELSCLPR